MIKRYNDFISESITDHMKPKEGAIEKVNKMKDKIAPLFVEEGYFDNIEDVMGFLNNKGIEENITNMMTFELTPDEIAGELSQFNMDEYLHKNGLPLKFAVNPEWKDDVNIVGSEAYNKSKNFTFDD